MDIIFKPLLGVISLVLDFVKFAVFAYIVLGWLEVFKIINPYNNLVYTIHNALFAIVEPMLNPLRRYVPTVSNIDLSPVALILGIYFLQMVIYQLLIRFP